MKLTEQLERNFWSLSPIFVPDCDNLQKFLINQYFTTLINENITNFGVRKEQCCFTLKFSFHHLSRLGEIRNIIHFWKPHQDLSANLQWEIYKKLDNKCKHANKHCCTPASVSTWPFTLCKEIFRPMNSK
jgi:hypothetical protein